jgi:hypothetical protein
MKPKLKPTGGFALAAALAIVAALALVGHRDGGCGRADRRHIRRLRA